MTAATPTIPPPSQAHEQTVAAPSPFVALMYHNVYPDGRPYTDLSPSATSYFIPRSTFAAHLSELSAVGGSCMTWGDVTSFYTGSPRPTRPAERFPVLLTFDDGWRDSVEVAGPLLEQHRCSAVLFVTLDFLGRRHFLSRADVSRIGTVALRVGSHARTHRMLSLLPEDEIRAELADSKKALEDLAGYEVDSLSIPSGAVDRRVRRIAAECGYRFVFDSEVRVNSPGDSALAIGRVAVMSGTALPVFRRYVHRRIGREKLRRTVLTAPKRVLGLPRYERLRRRLLGEKPGQRVTHASATAHDPSEAE